MSRPVEFMQTNERDIQYLDRIQDVDGISKKDLIQKLVNFVLEHDIEIEPHQSSSYLVFSHFPTGNFLYGGLGSIRNFTKSIFGNSFNYYDFSMKITSHLQNLYSKIDRSVGIKAGRINISLKENFNSLSDVVFIEFEYRATIHINDYEFYPIDFYIQYFIDEQKISFEQVKSDDFFDNIRIKTDFSNNDFTKPFIDYYKNDFCKKLNLNVDDFNDDMNTLIQMMDI